MITVSFQRRGVIATCPESLLLKCSPLVTEEQRRGRRAAHTEIAGFQARHSLLLCSGS